MQITVDCCVINLFSYRNGAEDNKASKRTLAEGMYNQLLHDVWNEGSVDLESRAPREWPSMPYLSDDELQHLVRRHRSVLPPVTISDYAINLVQRLL